MNNFVIDSPDKVQIEGARGTHTGGKTNNDEIYFHALFTTINYFPQGLEKIFPNLVGIYMQGTKLKGIQQSDLKSYTKLTYLCLHMHDIQFLENDLFDFNPNLEHVLFQSCKIVHIGLNVFDNLNKLSSLFLSGNQCSNKFSKNNDRTDVQRIINELKSQCQDSDFLNLDQKIGKLVLDVKSLNSENFPVFRQNVENFESELNSSKFSGFSPQKKRFENLKILKIDDITSTSPMTSLASTIRLADSQLLKSETEQCPSVENQTKISSIYNQVGKFQAENANNFRNLSTLVSESFTVVNDKFSGFNTKFSILNEKLSTCENLNGKFVSSDKKQVEEFTTVNQKLTEFDSKFDQKFSILNQKLTNFEDQIKGFAEKFLTFDEKFTNLAEKFENHKENSEQNNAQMLDKIEKSLQVARFNILKTVESKIEKLEKRLEGKFEEILNILKDEK